MYEISIQHYGESYEKKTHSVEQAIQWAEDAVYEIGADNAIVYNPDGSILVEYEM